MSIFKEFLIREEEERRKLRKEVLHQTFKALEDLSKNVKFKRAYIFGSLAWGKFYTQSDVDIAFEKLENEKIFYVVGFLSEKIGRNVDVIELEKLPKNLKEKILKEGIPWNPS